MTKKSWIVVIVLTVGLLAGMVWLARGNKTNVDDIDITKLQSASSKNGNIAEHVFGKKDSKVVLIEYGDFQCPGCGSAFPVMQQLSQKYKDKIAFVFRNKPLVTIHPNALAAAASAEAAGLQGKYWEMHDKLYENQDNWKDLTGEDRTNFFVSLATGLGLNESKFKSDINSSDVRKKIDFDTSLSEKAKTTGTPSFFLNGKAVDQNVLDGKLVPSGTTGSQAVWADANNFENLILIPALKENGIATS